MQAEAQQAGQQHCGDEEPNPPPVRPRTVSAPAQHRRGTYHRQRQEHRAGVEAVPGGGVPNDPRHHPSAQGPLGQGQVVAPRCAVGADGVIGPREVGEPPLLADEQGNRVETEHAGPDRRFDGPVGTQPGSSHHERSQHHQHHHQEQPVVGAGGKGRGQAQPHRHRPASTAPCRPGQGGLDGEQDGPDHDELQDAELVHHERQPLDGETDQDGDERLDTEPATQPCRRPAVQHQRTEQDQVVGEHLVAGEQVQRGEGQAGQRFGLGEGEGASCRVEDGGLPVAGVQVAQAVGVPTQRPEVEQGDGRRRLGADGDAIGEVQGRRPRRRQGTEHVHQRRGGPAGRGRAGGGTDRLLGDIAIAIHHRRRSF